MAFHPLRVSSVERLTDDSAAVTFDVPDDLREEFDFVAGQSLTLRRMVEGREEIPEIDTLEQVTKQVEGHTICALGDAAAWPIQGLIRHFRPVMEERIATYRARSTVRMAAE